MLENNQSHKLLEINFPLNNGNNCFILKKFYGIESISKLFCYTLTITANKTSQKAQSFLGQSISFQINHHSSKQPRYFNGIMSEMVIKPAIYPQAQEIVIKVVPWIWFLDQVTDYRAFKNITTLDIVKKLFKEYGYNNFNCSGIQGNYSKRRYCVQYNETTLHFIERLLAEEGIFYFFEHSKNKHTVILGDHITAYHSITRPIPLANRYAPSENHIYDGVFKYAYYNKKITLNDYYFKSPGNTLISSSNVTMINEPPTNEPLEIYHYPGEFRDPASGKRQSRLILQHQKMKKIEFNAASQAIELNSGCCFQCSGLKNTGTKKYLITCIEHWATEATQNGNIQSYYNHIQCIPNHILFCPQYDPKPIIKGIQTAEVININNKEIATDKFARCKVKFPWMERNESSHWLRVNQSWSDQQWGSQFLPHTKHEVLINFSNGNPDRPIIAGSSYNKTHLHPYKLPEEVSKSGIRSHTMSGGNDNQYNEICFDDTLQKEILLIRAKRDLHYQINNSLTETITNNQITTIQQGNQLYEILNDTATWQAEDITLQTGSSKIYINQKGIHFDSQQIQLLCAGVDNLKAIARVGDPHTCPKYHNNTLPHNGGPILKGSPNVFINNKPAARVKDVAHCDHKKNKIKQGALGLLVNNQCAAREQDETIHGGVIKSGSSNVKVGQHLPIMEKTLLPDFEHDNLIVEFAVIDMHGDKQPNIQATQCKIQPNHKAAQCETINDNEVFFERLDKNTIQNVEQISLE